MLVPDSDFGVFDNYNYQQSSNRMHIECAFGMLINKWAILWHPLNVKFKRCVPLINACFYLHNFCIENKMIKEHTLITQGNYVKVQLSLSTIGAVWAKKPIFDKRGRPVEYLN